MRETTWHISMILALTWTALGAAPVAAADFADPTQPAHVVAAPSGGGRAVVNYGPVLQATRLSAGGKIAVIDGKSYRTGDQVAGGEIVDIQPYEVVLRMADRAGGHERRLRLVPPMNKETAVGKDSNP